MSAVWNNSPVFTCVFSPVWHNHVSCLEQLTSVYVCFFHLYGTIMSAVWNNSPVLTCVFFSISGD